VQYLADGPYGDPPDDPKGRSEMRTLIFLLVSVLLFAPITADAQDGRAAF